MNTTAPIEIATRHTLEFFAQHVAPGADLIEVGCGDGDLAAALVGRGYRVRAVDAEADCVAAARARGLDASQALWPAFDGEPAAAVAFTRSLHHIHPLPPALARARALLESGGALLLEDFAYDTASARLLDWFAGVLQRGFEAGLLGVRRDGLAHRLLAATDRLGTWRSYHDGEHHLHTGATMRASIRREFARCAVSPSAYLYRYLIPLAMPSEAAGRLVEDILLEETSGIARGDFEAIGLRMVARH